MTKNPNKNKKGEIIMGSKSIRKPFSNPKPKRQLPGDPNPGALPDPMPKPFLPGDPKPIPKRPGVPEPIPKPLKRG